MMNDTLDDANMTVDDMLQEFEDYGLSVWLFKSETGIRQAQIYKMGTMVDASGHKFDIPGLVWYTNGVGSTRVEALEDALERVTTLRKEIESEGGRFEDY
jgi:hypothetical protein